MGESSAEGPSPETVAGAFTNVYYKVAEQQPHRLAELYGVDSQLSHAPGTVATGLADIGAAVLSLPLSKEHRANVSTIDAMRTGKGGYIVLVTGSLGSAMFAQTFLLDPTGDDDSRKHFYCRNDVFRFVTPSSGKLATPADVLHPTHAEPVQVNVTGVPSGDGFNEGMDAGDELHGKTVNAEESLQASASRLPDSGDTQDDEDDDDEDDEEDDEDDEEDDDDVLADGQAVDGMEGAEGAIADNQNNLSDATESHVDPSVTMGVRVEGASTIAMAVPVPSSDLQELLPTDSEPNGHVNENKSSIESASASPKKVAEISPSKPATPKSWASIVSSSTAITAGISSTSAAQTGSGSAHTLMGTSDSSVVSPGIAVYPSTVAEGTPLNAGNATKAVAVPPGSGSNEESNTDDVRPGSSSRVTGTASGSTHGGWSSVEGKRHSYQSDGNVGFKVVGRSTDGHSHMNGHPHPPQSASGAFHKPPAVHRVYGPSAVIQLGNLPPERMRDWRGLVEDFTKEFAGYGHDIRNVDVKTYKSLAFVEYDTVEGVRAAVSAWADGPRDSGPFKGIALAVSEKRQQRRPIPGGDRGGFVGGRVMMPRGGGRGAGGRGRGRGAPFASGPTPNQPGSHAATTPAAASS
jgi:hypothetical protein